MSAKTGIAATLATDQAVAKNENDRQITSSPSSIPRAINDINSSSTPDQTSIASFTLR